MEVLTILKANIRHKKSGFISVLILCFVISLCLTSIISVNSNVKKRAEAALQEVHTGNLVGVIREEQYTQSMASKIQENPDVDHVSEIKTIVQKLEINKKVQASSTFLAAYNPQQYPYRVFTENGLSFQENPPKLKQGELYVPISFKSLYKCKTGDKAYLGSGDTQEVFTIKGFIEEPFIGAEMIGIKQAFMNSEDFERIHESRCTEEKVTDDNAIVGYSFIHVFQKADSKLNIGEFKKAVNESSELVSYSLLSFTSRQSISFSLMFTQIAGGILMAFLVLLFVVVQIVAGHSISTGIEMEYTSLGVLKALGYSKNKLRLVFALEYLCAELIGIILGIAGSIPSIYFLNGVFVSLTGLLSEVKVDFALCLPLLLAILLVSAVFILVKTRKIAKISPIVAISGGKNSVYFRSRFELPVTGRGLNWRMAFRQITSNKRQYISSAVIVAILVFFLISITVLNLCMDEETLERNFGDVPCDISVIYPEDQDVHQAKELQMKVEEELNGISPVTEKYQRTSKYFTINGEEYLGIMYSDPTLLSSSVLKGRAPKYDNEIIITEIVAEELGVKIGDTVTVANKDKDATYMISGLYQSTYDVGRVFAFSLDAAGKLIPTADQQKNILRYVIEDSTKSAQAVDKLEEEFKDQIEVKDESKQNSSEEAIAAAIKVLNVIIYTISIIFSFIVILIVCGKIFLKEQVDYGIYKAVGFSSGILRMQFAIRFFVVALTGSIIGVLANVLFNDSMMNALLINIGVTSYTTEYSISGMLIPVLVICISFFIFSYYISGKIKKVTPRNLITE